MDIPADKANTEQNVPMGDGVTAAPRTPKAPQGNGSAYGCFWYRAREIKDKTDTTDSPTRAARPRIGSVWVRI